jgi:uncharacterized membrane protein
MSEAIAEAKPVKPELRPFSVSDLIDAIAAGIRDFRRAPLFGLLFAGLFAAGGWLVFLLLWQLGMPYFAYPLAMGFALIAPFAATGFYAVSDHIEKDKSLAWASVFGSIKRAARGELRWMALITAFALIIWMDIAAFLFFAFSNFQLLNWDSFLNLLSTPTGWVFAFLGNAAGALIALAVFSISVVSFPMLYERQVDFVTAMTTSVKLVMENPKAMVTWCVLIALAIVLSVVTGFIGLLIAMPVIGHATWHIYRRAVVPLPAGS